MADDKSAIAAKPVAPSAYPSFSARSSAKPATALSWADWQLLRADSTSHSTVMLTRWLLEQPILDDGISSNRLCPQRPGAV